MIKTIQGRLYRQLETTPGKKALAFVNPQGAHSWRSLEEICGEASASGAILAEMGLARGDVCFLVLPSNAACATLLLAALMQGAVPLLMAPPTIHSQGRYSSLAQVLKYVIRKINPRVVALPGAMQELRDDLKGRFKKTSFVFGPEVLIKGTSATISPVIPSGNHIASLQLTSGTTGFPHICVWQQKKVVAALDCMSRAMRLREGDVVFNWTPLYHDMGLVNNFFLCLTFGVPLVMLNPLDFVRQPALWLRGLSVTNSTLTWSPNFGFAISTERIKDEEMQGVRLEHVRAFWNAAERIHPETVAAFYQRFEPFGLRQESLKTAYGLAENIGAATFSDLKTKMNVERLSRAMLQTKGLPVLVRKPCDDVRSVQVVGVGRPCPGMEVKILGREGRVLPEGYIGQVAFKTPSAMTCYLENRRATRHTLKRGLLCTGDLGYVRGKELFWVGRRRERITTMGKKLDPSDFDQILSKIPGLRTGCFAAFGVDDVKEGTQRVVVASEVKNSIDRPYRDLVNDIRKQIFLSLGVRVHRAILVPTGTLTKTSSGKRRHLHFRELYLNGDLQKLDVLKQTQSEVENANIV